MNEKFSKDEYERKIAQYDLSQTEGKRKAISDFNNLREKFVVKALNKINCENCFGDYLVGCKDCNEIYFSDGCRDSKNILRGTEDINSYDAVVGGKIELCYDLLQPGWCYKCAFIINCNRCNEVYLSESCTDCEHCIGCISLKRAKFCIFNKKYSEEEYHRLKEKIFAEIRNGIGFEEFFNLEKSPFKYEETIADIYFPKTEIRGDFDFGEGKCTGCGKEFSFSEAEKDFYKKMNLALPEKCFYCRILGLARPYSGICLKSANCASCGEEVFTAKSGAVYCEKCYLKAVY